MIRSVSIGEEIVITTTNKVGLLADIALVLSNEGVNIEAVEGYEVGKTAKLMLITDANLRVVSELKKGKYKQVKEVEVLLVELENKPGTLKVVTTELKEAGIDITDMYLTSTVGRGSSRMVLQTSDNENAMAVLSKYIEHAAE